MKKKIVKGEIPSIVVVDEAMKRALAEYRAIYLIEDPKNKMISLK